MRMVAPIGVGQPRKAWTMLRSVNKVLMLA